MNRASKVRAEKMAKGSKGTAILAIKPEDYSDAELKAIKETLSYYRPE